MAAVVRGSHRALYPHVCDTRGVKIRHMSAGLDWVEYAARMFEPQTPRWATPGDLAKHIDPRIVQTPALNLIDEALTKVLNTPDGGLIISMPPQEGKSQRASRAFPLWALTQNPNLRVAITSYEHDVARRWGRSIRDDLRSHDLDLTVREDLSAQHEWQLAGHDGGVYTAGVGGALTGRPVDLLIIDDPIKGREQADSPTYRERAWDWWTDTARTRLAPGAPVVLILTRWHEDDLAGRILDRDEGRDWEVLSIPAQCEDPDTDPLGRELGQFMQSARGRTTGQWEAIKAGSPSRTWAALYQQHPVPAEGAVWKAPWIDTFRGKTGEVHHRLTRTLVSVDPAVSSKHTSDLTGIIVTGIDNTGHAWVLDDRTLRGTPSEWGTAVWDALLDWNATEVVIEDNQGGEMVLEVLQTTWATTVTRRAVRRPAPKVTRVHASQSKRVRAEAVAAYYETGRVHHAADGTDRLHQLEQQMLTWTGDGKSPDRIDALVHGLDALFTNTPGPINVTQRRRDRTR